MSFGGQGGELSRSEIHLVGKAIREWVQPDDGEKYMAILESHASSDNPRVSLAALKEINKCRELDLKQLEFQLKRQIAEDAQRLRIIKQLAALDPAIVTARLATLGAGNGRTIESGNSHVQEAGIGSRPEDPDSEKPKPKTRR
jgi:hypothetical protein